MDLSFCFSHSARDLTLARLGYLSEHGLQTQAPIPTVASLMTVNTNGFFLLGLSWGYLHG